MPDDLLYISPVIPNVTGNGLAMRAAAVLEALSAHYRVSLLVVPLYAPYGSAIPDAIERRCVRGTILSSPWPTAIPASPVHDRAADCVREPVSVATGALSPAAPSHSLPSDPSPGISVSLWTVIRQLIGWRRGATAAQPASRFQTPASWFQTPASGSQTPASGSQTPADGSQTPVSGFSGLPFAEAAFSVIHVFRLATLPYANPYLERSPEARVHLDLDDIDSVTRRRLAALYRLNGLEKQARTEEWMAERDRVAEDEAFAQVDRVYVCSNTDRAALCARTHTEIVVLPNVVRSAPAIESPRTETGGPVSTIDSSGAVGSNRPFNILFVGTMGYYPNQDAASYLCTEVLPILRSVAPCDFTVTVVGGGPDEILAPLQSIRGVRVAGAVPDIEPYYRDADAVVVPMRAGGGTRIKVLEAFSFRRPVVSTSIGVEGLAVEDGTHVLLGDDPETLAQQCASLMADGELRACLATHAALLVTRLYTPDALSRIVGQPISDFGQPISDFGQSMSDSGQSMSGFGAS